ncbi:ribosomal protein L52 [Balamuthia mandrillaris]
MNRLSAGGWWRRNWAGVSPMVTRQCLLSHSRAGGHWRASLGQNVDGTADGPLYDLPDWEFADGRSAPVSAKRKSVIRRRKIVTQRIKQLREEVMEIEKEEWSRGVRK